ncbi:hypothetical protein Tco_0313063 [Tanacetum coccineum]
MKQSASWRGNLLKLQPWQIRDVSPMLYPSEPIEKKLYVFSMLKVLAGVFKVFDLCLNLIIESGEEMLDMQNNQHTLCYDLYFDHVCWFIDPVEGFNIFNSSNTEPVLEESKESELAPQRKKEFNRKTNVCLTAFKFRDAIFCKQHNIHTSGTNIPSPLQDFSELSSKTIPGIKRIECKAHHNGPSLGIHHVVKFLSAHAKDNL